MWVERDGCRPVLAVPGELVPSGVDRHAKAVAWARDAVQATDGRAGRLGRRPARTVSREHIARIVRCHAEAALGRAANGHQVVPVVDERWLLPSAVVIVHVPGIARCEAHVWCCARQGRDVTLAGCAVEQGRGRPGRPVPRVGVAVKSGSHALLCRRAGQTHDKGQVVARVDRSRWRPGFAVPFIDFPGTVADHAQRGRGASHRREGCRAYPHLGGGPSAPGNCTQTRSPGQGEP